MSDSHKETALRLLEVSEETGKFPDSDLGKLVEVAQVHATLALVEQTRLANLIAFNTKDSAGYFPYEWMSGDLEAVVREGLGLS